MSMWTTWPTTSDDDDPTLVWLDDWLAADRDVEPPPAFAAGVLNRLERELVRVPPWRRALVAIGVLTTGVLLLAWTATQLAAEWSATVDASPMIGVAVHVATGVAAALLSLTPSPAVWGGRVAVYALAAIAMATLWFGATVAPRGLVARSDLRRRL